MKKYIIPIGMGTGSLFGLLAGIILKFSPQVTMCAGAALGIILGAAIQIIVNYMYPDEYFSKKKKKEDAEDVDSLFSELSDTNVHTDSHNTSHIYRSGRIIENSDDDISVPRKEEQWERQYMEIQRKKQQTNPQRNTAGSVAQGRPLQGRPPQNKAVRSAARPPVKPPVKKKHSIFEEPGTTANYSSKKRIIIEEDDD